MWKYWYCFFVSSLGLNVLLDICTEKSHFDLKSWVTGGTIIWPENPNNLKILESNWLSISSQFDSNNLQLLGIPGRILVPPVTQLFSSKWLHFFFQCVTSL